MRSIAASPAAARAFSPYVPAGISGILGGPDDLHRVGPASHDAAVQLSTRPIRLRSRRSKNAANDTQETLLKAARVYDEAW
jgi:hypothetical protein